MTPKDPPTAPSLVASLARGADDSSRRLFFDCHETLEALRLAKEEAQGNA